MAATLDIPEERPEIYEQESVGKTANNQGACQRWQVAW